MAGRALSRVVAAGKQQERKTTGEDRIPAVWRGQVTERTEGGAWIVIPQLSAEARLGPVEQLEGLDLAPGDRVLVMMVEGRKSDPVVIGRLTASHNGDT